MTGTREQTGWVGWIIFAAIMLAIGGTLNAIYGLIAIVNDTWVGFNEVTNNAVVLDVSAWGWIHLLLGIVAFIVGLGLMTGNVLARTFGVIVASVGLIANFLWLPVYPIWSIVIITIDALVIWALIVHGDEMKV